MSPRTHLSRTDGLLVAGTVAVAVVAGLIFAPVTDFETLHLLDLATNVLIFSIIAVMLVPLFLASRHWGGEIGRNLQIVAVGLLVFVVSILPHIEWHVEGAPYYLGPAMLGLSPAWWVGFFHTLTVATWIVVIYGFYRFWRLARPRPDRTHD